MTEHAHDDHSDGHAHNHEAVTADNARRVMWAMLLTGGLMIVELVGGLLAGSLALIADAGHMLADTFALGLAFAAFRLSRRPADAARSFGYHRFQVLAAFVNGGALLAIVGWIIFEAVKRLIHPEPVAGGLMMGVAFVGLAANILGALILHGGDRNSLNMRSAWLHVMSDLLGSAGAIAAAGIILATGWYAADPIISIIISLLILRGAWRVLKESGHILMEGAPGHLDAGDIRNALMASVAGVEDVHHVHLWSLTEVQPMVTLHAKVADPANSNAILRAINTELKRRFGITHATIQIESGDCADHAPSAVCTGIHAEKS